jgi:hypothetical protein
MLALVAVACAGAACGKKGPPLAPLVPIPGAVEAIQAQPLGRDVYVSLTLPAVNIDGHVPADLARVDVYAYTGRTAPPRARWVEMATLVATVPVAPPPKPAGKPDDEKERADASDAAKKDDTPAPAQGEVITVHDTLTADELVQGREPPRDPRSAVRGPQSAVRDPHTAVSDPQAAARAARAAEQPLKRFYTAVPFNAKGRPGPPGGVAEFPLMAVPDPPPAVAADYSDRAVMLTWEPSGGLLGFLLERVLPEEPTLFLGDEAAEAAIEPPGPLSYHVYREVLPDPSTPPGASSQPWREEVPTPITLAPVPTTEFIDSVEFGRRRCYTVRSVRGIGPAARVGDASPPACFTATDVFPPAPPRGLATVASEGAINLVWQPNTELDLAGYVVLRGEAPGDTLQPLTSAPIPQAAYRDETVMSGVRYVYAVVAVDNRMPLPNTSGASERAEETAR